MALGISSSSPSHPLMSIAIDSTVDAVQRRLLFEDDTGVKEWRESHNIEMPSLGGSSASGANLDKFFENVEGVVKEEMKEMERLRRSFHKDNEAGKMLHAASAVRSLSAHMDSDISLALKKAKLIKLCLESLDRANAANRSVPDCTRSSVVAGLRKKLKDTMDAFSDLRTVIGSDYRKAVARRYYTVI